MSKSNSISEVLFNKEAGVKKFYEKKEYNKTLLEQYKIYVEMADRISSRRQTANSFFLSVNTAIVALLGYLKINTQLNQYASIYWLIPIAGIVLSYTWYRLIKSYKDLNTAKFKVIHEMEKKLPTSPYDAEWVAAGRGENPKLYLPFTHIEIRIPWVFLSIHVIVLIFSIPWHNFLMLIYALMR